MKIKARLLFLILLTGFLKAHAQKPFSEGIIVYNVRLQSADQKTYTGLYSFTIKGSQIKKELKLTNGYEEIQVLNCTANQAFSLKSVNGEKYAIQLNMADITKHQAPFIGLSVKNETNNNQNIAGKVTYKATVAYKDGSESEVVYTKEWFPALTVTFDRFPDVRFLPLSFTYKDERGATMQFDAVKVEAQPVENAIFRIPTDFKMIRYEEYQSMRR
jgi:hypothetical protein